MKKHGSLLSTRKNKYDFYPVEDYKGMTIRRFVINPSYFIRSDGAIINGNTGHVLHDKDNYRLSICIYNGYRNENWFRPSLCYTIAFPESMNGFKKIPGYKYYCVNELGEVRKSIDGGVMYPVDSGGYMVISLISDTGSRDTRKVHHLVMMTFKPDDFAQVSRTLHKGAKVVNHIDGNKKNNALGNLEVITMSDNSVHALNAGLWTTNKPVVIRWEETGEERTFKSMKEASEFLGYQADCIMQRLERPDYLSCLWHDGTRVRLVSDGDWLPVTNAISSKGNHLSISLVAKNIITGDEEIFPSIRKFHEKYGYQQNFIKSKLGEKLENQPVFDKLVRLKAGFGEWVPVKGYVDVLHELDAKNKDKLYVFFTEDKYPKVLLPTYREPFLGYHKLEIGAISKKSNGRNVVGEYKVLRYSDYILTDHYLKYGQDLSKFTFVK